MRQGGSCHEPFGRCLPGNDSDQHQDYSEYNDQFQQEFHHSAPCCWPLVIELGYGEGAVGGVGDQVCQAIEVGDDGVLVFQPDAFEHAQ